MSEAIAIGIHRRELYPLRDKRELEIVSRGLYRLVEMPALSLPDFIPVAKKIPNGVKTLVDCVKFRNKIGMNVVLEALKMYWHSRKTNLDKLFEYAKLFRVEKILKPIMETIVSG